MDKNVHLRTGPKWTSHGITLIALIITIIILLILAGITIGAITGDNSLINQAGEAKEDAEIASEKEVIDNATIEAMGKNKYGNLEEEEFQNALDSQTGGKAEVTDVGGSFEVYFTDSKRYYAVDSNGNVGDFTVAVTDPYPGDITKDENGNTLDGSSASPYQINCIEDLVAFSNMINVTGMYFKDGQLTEVTEVTNMNGKYIVLTRDLNFKSRASYIDSQRTDFGDINGDDSDGNVLMTEMSTGTGFRPIGINTGNGASSFYGNFNGQGNKIDNIYIDYSNDEILNSYNNGRAVGLFGTGNSAVTEISNLEISGNIKGYGHTGGIIGNEIKNIDNCINRADVSGKNMTGGIIGYNGKVTNCTNYGKIKVTGSTVWSGAGAGGIAGSVQEVVNCENYGKIEIDMELPNTYGGYGGIVASTPGIVDNCINYGDIVIKNQTRSQRSGGIIGMGSNFTIRNCENKGNINGQGNIGGIIGQIYSGGWDQEITTKIENCINKGNLQNKMSGSVGGIVGSINNIYKSNMAYFKNCCNTVNLETGIVGLISDSTGTKDFQFENVYDCNEIHIKTQNSNVTYTGEVTKKTTEEMKAKEFIDLLNSYKDESGAYPSDWNKWQLGEDGYPTFVEE